MFPKDPGLGGLGQARSPAGLTQSVGPGDWRARSHVAQWVKSCAPGKGPLEVMPLKAPPGVSIRRGSQGPVL